MSRTLFWYIMRDLLRIFIMTSLTLAGIMAFGGLLKPLMQYGLSGTQVAQMLAYFMPATQTYSLPIAALFATTVVYGRLSADNELTACRAAGVSYLTLAMPAFVLGLILAIASLASLSFLVPHFTLKVEKVAFASLAEMMRTSVQRSHQIKYDRQNVIYAERAEILPPDPSRPNEEVVRLHSPIFCQTEVVMDETGKHRLAVPSEFFTAKSATVVIRQGPEQAEFLAYLEDGVRFPRNLEGSQVGGIGAAQFGPIPIPSLIGENTKFMDIQQLKSLYNNPLRSESIRRIYLDITRREQEQAFMGAIIELLRGEQEYAFIGAGGESLLLRVEGETRRLLREGRVKVVPTKGKPDELSLASVPGARDIRLIHLRDGEIRNTDEVRAMTLRVQSDLQSDRVRMEFQLADVLVGSTPDQQTVRPRLPRPFSVAAPSELMEIKQRGPEYYLAAGRRGDLYTKLSALRSGIAGEIHGRASFAISCLILVMVGCALGMMFKTGNYLSAFALSVIPALLAIALAVTGQHVAKADARNLALGLAIIWSGNAIVLVLATVLLGKLQRQ